jgi:DNA-binding PadR family transcriptional regulator
MTNAELAILSLIAEQPRHGYDLEQIIEARGMREWTEIGFSSIYYLLNKLEDGGLVESQLRQTEGKGPARKIYRITQIGRQALIERALAALSAPQSGSSPFLLGLANYPLIPREQLLDALNSYVARLGDRVRHIGQRAEAQRPLPAFVQAMFDYSQHMLEAERRWMQRFIEEVEAGNVES